MMYRNNLQLQPIFFCLIPFILQATKFGAAFFMSSENTPIRQNENNPIKAPLHYLNFA